MVQFASMQLPTWVKRSLSLHIHPVSVTEQLLTGIADNMQRSYWMVSTSATEGIIWSQNKPRMLEYPQDLALSIREQVLRRVHGRV